MVTQLLIKSTDKIDLIDEVNARGITGYAMERSYISKILVSII
jgi:hypothetical protein